MTDLEARSLADGVEDNEAHERGGDQLPSFPSEYLPRSAIRAIQGHDAPGSLGDFDRDSGEQEENQAAAGRGAIQSLSDLGRTTEQPDDQGVQAPDADITQGDVQAPLESRAAAAAEAIERRYNLPPLGKLITAVREKHPELMALSGKETDPKMKSFYTYITYLRDCPEIVPRDDISEAVNPDGTLDLEKFRQIASVHIRKVERYIYSVTSNPTTFWEARRKSKEIRDWVDFIQADSVLLYTGIEELAGLKALDFYHQYVLIREHIIRKSGDKAEDLKELERQFFTIAAVCAAGKALNMAP